MTGDLRRRGSGARHRPGVLGALHQGGQVLVLTAVLMLALCVFLGLALDLGFMYLAKAELQNAADAAALAGASRLPAQTAARAVSQSMAADNEAAKLPISISSSGSNTLSPDNDITVGNWSRNLEPPYLAGRTPVNAIEVRARRTADSDTGGQSNDGPVNLFFARLINARWSQMGVSATAVARRPPKAGFYLLLGRDTCNTLSFPLFLSPQSGNMAWTSLLNSSSNTADTLDKFICPVDKLPDVEVCGASIYTTNGTANPVFQGVEADFYDPSYDRTNKTYRNDGAVSSWTIIVPVATVNDPSIQPSPQPVWGYAEMELTRACGAGLGNPCPGRSFQAPAGTCPGAENGLTVRKITCVDCAHSDQLLGSKPSLAR